MLKLVIIFCNILAVLMTAHCAGYRLNLTRSEPIGLYKVVPEIPKRGDLASFCLSQENEYKELTADRNYLGTSLLCPSGQKPLLKELVGTTGDSITVEFSSIRVNDAIFILIAGLTTATGASCRTNYAQASFRKAKRFCFLHITKTVSTADISAL